MKKEATEKRKYESPELTAVEFRTERGYLLSGKFLALHEDYMDEGSEVLESRNDDNHYFWGNNSEGWF